ncbi:MAG: hypothetical protein KFF73_16985 [Cyclobacteriaceae bacterium]|nr:hypothetical protein [Cyclobacteriaceae bacterium]
MENYLKYLIPEEIYLVNEERDHHILENTPGGDDQVEDLVKKTLVLIHYPGAGSISESGHQLLSGILRAVKLQPEEVFLLDLGKPGLHQNLLKNFNLEDCRILGFLETLSEQVQDVFPTRKYQIRSTGNFRSLMADPLETIGQDRAKKKILWEKLQDLFQM